MRRHVFSNDGLRRAAKIPVMEKSLVYPLHHTSLHRWLTGLGEKALDRSEWITTKFLPSTAAIVAETSRLHGVNLSSLLPDSDVKLSPGKYRSERRKDQLSAVVWIFLIATMLFGKKSQDVLKKWVCELLPVFNVVVWDFLCSYSVTSFQHVRPP